MRNRVEAVRLHDQLESLPNRLDLFPDSVLLLRDVDDIGKAPEVNARAIRDPCEVRSGEILGPLAQARELGPEQAVARVPELLDKHRFRLLEQRLALAQLVRSREELLHLLSLPVLGRGDEQFRLRLGRRVRRPLPAGDFHRPLIREGAQYARGGFELGP